MKRSICMGLFAVGVLLIALASMAGAQGPGPQSSTGTQAALGTAFTYQGELRTASGPVSGTCDFQFSLWDALSNGAQVGSTQAVNGVSVVNGRFAVQLDFGSSAFGGDARWLQIAVQCGGDAGFTTLAPRQPLTPAPYALYSPRSAWSGLSGVPASLADNVDNDTTYAAGSGLNLAGNQFSVNTTTIQARVSGPCGAGFAIRVVNADGSVTCEAIGGSQHNHLGQTWTGSNNPLVITGTFGAPTYAPLVLGNTHANGSGVRVEKAGLIGVNVAEAGTAGVWVSHAGEYGVGVYKAGSPSYLVMPTFPSGFQVEGSEGYGLYVGQADMDGAYVWSAGGDGVHVRLAGGDGVDATSTDASAYGGRFVNSATGGAGLYARSGDGNAADIKLGSNSDTGTGDNGRIQSTDYGSSDLYLTSNDDIHIELDDNNDEDGVFRIDSQGIPVFQVEESGRANLANNAGWATVINIGDRYRDNSIIAWASVSSNGNIGWEFGVASVTRAGTGNYMIELDAHAAGVTALIPIAITEVESQPSSAAEVRIVSINQTADNIFRIYINNGNWAPVDNDFVFMVTAR